MEKKPPPPLSGSEQKKSKRGCIIAAIVCGVLAVLAIPIIGIFAELLFPAFSNANQAADTVHAEHDARNLKNAISVYFLEYRKYPVRNPTGDSTVRTEGELMAILLGNDSEGEKDGMNPRRITFLTGKQAKPTRDGGWRKGINPNYEENPGLYDPWGNPYWVKLDADNDNRLSEIDGVGELNESIAIWSAGPDGDPATWEDNIKSWYE